VRIFPVSARLGLAAKRAGDAELYERSGLKALEEALTVFLAEEKADVFLATVACKALCGSWLKRRGAFGQETIQVRATAAAEENAEGLRSPQAAVAAARAKIETLHANILAGRIG